MQIHHLALILAGLAGVLLVLLFKIATAMLARRRGAAPKVPSAQASIPDAAAETAEPPRQRNRQIVPVRAMEASAPAEDQPLEEARSSEVAVPDGDAPRGFYAALEARLAALFESYEAGETSITDYVGAVHEEARLVEAHDAELSAHEASGTIAGEELGDARQEADMAREAVAWCLDWAETQQHAQDAPGNADADTDPGLSVAA